MKHAIPRISAAQVSHRTPLTHERNVGTKQHHANAGDEHEPRIVPSTFNACRA